mgnify:CR=1 FL=1
MNNFETANQILTDIITKQIPFQVAIKNSCEKNEISRESRSLITGLVGCELRHHLLFRSLVKEQFQFNHEEEEKYFPLYLILANEIYYHRFDYNQIVLNASKMCDISTKDINDFISGLKIRTPLLPKDIQEGSLEHLSLRFNTPLWLVKMWDKQFGRTTCFKVLKYNSKTSKLVCGVNSKITSVEKLTQGGDFIPGPVDNSVIYQGKEVLRTTNYSKYHNVYLQRASYIDIINKLDIDPFKKVAILSGFSNNILLDLYFIKNISSKIDIIVPEFKDYTDLKNNAKQFHIDNIFLYDAKAGMIDSCISEPVDLFLLLARNTNYDLFSRQPDYFLYCKNQKLDSLINEQRYSLEEAYKVLNVGGQLVYAVPTLNKKETSLLIKDFLLIHRDMSLLEEKQYMPFDEGEALLYYAKMIKTNHKYD